MISGHFFGFETDHAVSERAELIAKEFVNAAGVDDLISDRRSCLDQVEIICFRANVDALQHFLTILV